jgi:ADP-dependent NAD(P)H-hydrate dehydratase / NAD(P)H-hydrate epimerase
MELLTAEEMRLVDEKTISQVGIPGIVLMENAGAAAASLLERLYPSNTRFAVVCGRGNNGGDGAVVARRLKNAGYAVQMFLVGSEDALLGDAVIAWRAAINSGVQVIADCSLSAFLAAADVVVDALLGTGMAGAPRGAVLSAIASMNQSGKDVFSLDLPSGVDATTGDVPGEAVHATHTVTFGAPKTGLVQFPAAAHTGTLHVAAIEVPDSCLRDHAHAWLTMPEDVAAVLPKRVEWSHKGSFGHVAVFAGSRRYPGAAHLASLGALHTGSGLVTLVTAGELWNAYAPKLLEIMLFPSGGSFEGSFAEDSWFKAKEVVDRSSAVVAGPGITTVDAVQEFLIVVLRNCEKPLLLDADALTILATSDKARDALKSCPALSNCVMTPHPGEAARLLSCTLEEVQKDRYSAARKLASTCGCVTVLKGSRSIIAVPDGRVWVNPTGNPGLATGGSGDVLAGSVASLMGQGLSALDAARTGAYIHGLAADLIARKMGDAGMAAGQVAAELPLALFEIKRLSESASPRWISRV